MYPAAGAWAPDEFSDGVGQTLGQVVDNRGRWAGNLSSRQRVCQA